MPKGGDERAERTTVNAIPAEQAPRSSSPTLRLVALLRAIFPDSVIDVDEVQARDPSSDQGPTEPAV